MLRWISGFGRLPRGRRRGFRFRRRSDGGWTLAETAAVVALTGVLIGIFVDGMAEWTLQYRRLLAARHCREALAVFREGARTPQVAERLTRGGAAWAFALPRCRLEARPSGSDPGTYDLDLRTPEPGRLPYLRPVRSSYAVAE